MKPAPFDYCRPESVEGALASLAEHGDDAKVLAGGQSLIPMIAVRLARPSVLVDVGRLPELTGIRVDGGTIAIRAATTQREIETSPVVRLELPALAEAIRHVGHSAIRNRGTIGGSAAHADPSAEIPAMMVLCDAECVVESSSGARSVAADEFFLSVFTTALRPDELLAEVRFPALGAGWSWGFAEVSRRDGDFALVGSAACVRAEDDGTIAEARLVVFGGTDRPARLRETESALVGCRLSDPPVAELARSECARLEAWTDLHASAAYRRFVASQVVARCLAGCAAKVPA